MVIKSYINSDGIIDFSYIDDIEGVIDIIHYGQAGDEEENSLANLLCDKQNFSNKLADPIPYYFEDIPFGNQYGNLNGNPLDENYSERIFVGYRYYDGFQKEVRFLFVFGLSYTKITIENISITNDDYIIKLTEILKERMLFKLMSQHLGKTKSFKDLFHLRR